jgi:hypothetical protein
MSNERIGPERKCVLEAYIKCLSRAECRIHLAGQIVNRRHVDLSKFHVQRRFIEHAANAMRERGIWKHAEALMLLQIKRSKLTAELEGIEW